jgi:putative ABC transport system permease protein
MHWLKITFRTLVKDARYSILNVGGLGVAFTAVIFIGLWIADELSYDRFHPSHEKLFQVWDTQRYSENTFTFTATPGPLAEALRNSIPEIEHATVAGFSSGLVGNPGKNFTETGIFTDEYFFRIFSYPLLAGDRRWIFSPQKKGIAISETLARKLFGSVEVLGKVVRYQDREDFEITAVFSDVPANSSVQFQFALPFTVFEKEFPWATRMDNNGVSTYISLFDPGTREHVNEKIHDFIRQRVPGSAVELFIWRYTDFRHYSKFVDGKYAGGRIEMIRNIGIVGLVILVMAVINFINLSTSRAVLRAKEVGVKKVVGASRGSLVFQFLMESFMLTMVAGILSLLFAQVVVPFYTSITGKAFTFALLDTNVWLAVFFKLHSHHSWQEFIRRWCCPRYARVLFSKMHHREAEVVMETD